MADLPPVKFPSAGDTGDPASPPGLALLESPPSADPLDVIASLRKALAEGANPPTRIIHAATELALILTGANGVALALRTNGKIVCRARSGDIAPALGAPLNIDSGISGECLRSAAVLLCEDATADPRVDPEACLALGIRSMVAVPLRGPAGIAGILEAFSTRTNAFGADAIESLRRLAEITEAAYESECSAKQATGSFPTSATIRKALSAAKTVSGPSLPNHVVGESPKRHYGIAGLAITALLLISLVAWFSWHDSASEIAADEPPKQSFNTPKEASHTPPQMVPLKPSPGTTRVQHEPTRDVLRNAAGIENAEEHAEEGVPSAEASRNSSEPVRSEGIGKSTTESPASDPPPTIEVAELSAPLKPPTLTSGPAALPTLEPRVSQGITEAFPIHKVDPIYPPQARVLRLNGSVVLDTTIAENGTVRKIKVISGPPMLAAAAAEAVGKWRYSPSLLNGTPIEVHRQITIIFRLP